MFLHQYLCVNVNICLYHCCVSHLTCPLWALAVVLQEAAPILSQSLDHLQSGQVLLVMQEALAPLLKCRGHREHVPEATVPGHCQLAFHQAKQ